MSSILRVPLGERESPTSYVSRLASLNGCNSWTDFCQDFRIEPYGFVHGADGALDRLAKLSDQPANRLGAWALRKDGDRYYLRGQEITKPLLSREKGKICPRCLADDLENGVGPTRIRPYGRTPWLLSPIRTCAVHGVALVDALASQGRRAYDFSVLSSRLPDLPRLSAEAQNRRPSELENYLFARLEPQTRSENWLDRLPWYAAARTCEMIGAVALHSGQVFVDLLTDAQLHEAGKVGFEICSSGEAAIGKALDALPKRSIRSRQYYSGLRNFYGRLYSWLAHEDQDHAYNPLRQILRGHALDTVPLKPDAEIFGVRVGTRRVHTLTSAARVAKAHRKRVGKILAQEDGVAGSGSIPAAKADAILTRLDGAMTLNKAAKYLNLPRAQARVLYKAKLIRPFITAGTGSMGSHSFARADLDYFLGKLRSNAVPIHGLGKNHTNIPGAAKRACCSAAEIVRAILDDKLAWKGILRGEKGYLAIVVNVEEVRPLVRRTDHGGWSLRDAERMLETSTAVVTALIEQGHLKSQVAVNPVNRCPQRIIPKDEMLRFQEKFISLASLAKRLGLYFGDLNRELQAAGIQPAFSAKAVRATFYRLDSVEKFHSRALSSQQA